MDSRQHAPRRRRALVAGLLALAAALATPVAPALAGGGNVVPANASPFGKSYAQWSAVWWQRYLGTANSDLTGAPCSIRDGQVALLAGTAGGAATRSCTVAPGTKFVLPLVNVECSTIEGNGTTQADLAACASSIADDFTSLHLTVDGKDAAGLTAFRFRSPLFKFVSVAGNPFGVPATGPGGTNSVADGYWVALTPLTPGSHTIRFGGSAPSFGFTTDATYNITVAG